MTSLLTRPVYSFDTETTNADPRQAQILQGGLVRVEADGSVGREAEWLLNPGVEISEEAIKIHGLSQEFIEANGRTDLAVALEEIASTLAKILNSCSPLIVFNAPYDLTVLEAECARVGIPGLLARLESEDRLQFVMDPMVLAKGVQHQIRRNFVKGQHFKLPDVCEMFGVEFEETHAATADAIGAARAFQAMVRDEAQLQQWGPRQFWIYQRSWRRAQQESLREYFDRNNIEHDGVDPSWPIYDGSRA